MSSFLIWFIVRVSIFLPSSNPHSPSTRSENGSRGRVRGRLGQVESPSKIFVELRTTFCFIKIRKYFCRAVFVNCTKESTRSSKTTKIDKRSLVWDWERGAGLGKIWLLWQLRFASKCVLIIRHHDIILLMMTSSLTWRLSSGVRRERHSHWRHTTLVLHSDRCEFNTDRKRTEETSFGDRLGAGATDDSVTSAVARLCGVVASSSTSSH